MPIQEINNLHKGVREGVVLVTLIYEEVGQSGICNELHEFLVESGFIHEGIVRPLAQVDLRPTRNVEVTVQGVPNDSLGVLF